MKKMIALLLACLMALGLMACHPAEDVPAASEGDAAPVGQAEAGQMDEADGGEVLSADTIDWFNTMYFNFNLIDGTYYNNLQNMMLASEYQNVRDVDLFSLFYDGIIGTYTAVSEQERAALEAIMPSAANLDITKITRTQMDKVLLQNAGLTLDETAMRGLDQFIYLEEYDAYYNVHGDSGATRCKIVSGWRNADGTVHLQYELPDRFATRVTGTVTLKRTETAYYFVSNVYDAQ